MVNLNQTRAGYSACAQSYTSLQKQRPEVVYKKGVLKKFAKFIG